MISARIVPDGTAVAGVGGEERSGRWGVAGKEGIDQAARGWWASATYSCGGYRASDVEAGDLCFEKRSITTAAWAACPRDADGQAALVAFDLLGRRWALRVLWELRESPVGFRALQERCGGMSSSVLRDRLAEFAGAGLLQTDEAGRYLLSPHGQALLEALKPLSRWADEWAAASEAG